jgi:hypothetical protein
MYGAFLNFVFSRRVCYNLVSELKFNIEPVLTKDQCELGKFVVVEFQIYDGFGEICETRVKPIFLRKFRSKLLLELLKR